MAFVTLEDLTGQIECLVFPRVYERYQPLLQEDEIVMMSGKLSIREEESPKLLADRIEKLDYIARERKEPPAPAPEKMTDGRTDAQIAAAAPRKLFLRLGRKQMDKASALLALSGGDIPVYMHIPEEKMTLLSPRSAWCDGSEKCLARLREELGGENVVLKG